jgi:hypothetical protein
MRYIFHKAVRVPGNSDLSARLALAVLAKAKRGDKKGHPFRGNQYTDSAGNEDSLYGGGGDRSPLPSDRGFSREDNSIDEAMEGFGGGGGYSPVEDLVFDFTDQAGEKSAWSTKAEEFHDEEYGSWGLEMSHSGKRGIQAKQEATRTLTNLGYEKKSSKSWIKSGQHVTSSIFAHPDEERGVAEIRQVVNDGVAMSGWTRVTFFEGMPDFNKSVRLRRLRKAKRGDREGHPFRGNQYVDSAGGDSMSPYDRDLKERKKRGEPDFSGIGDDELYDVMAPISDLDDEDLEGPNARKILERDLALYLKHPDQGGTRNNYTPGQQRRIDSLLAPLVKWKGRVKKNLSKAKRGEKEGHPFRGNQHVQAGEQNQGRGAYTGDDDQYSPEWNEQRGSTEATLAEELGHEVTLGDDGSVFDVKGNEIGWVEFNDDGSPVFQGSDDWLKQKESHEKKARGFDRKAKDAAANRDAEGLVTARQDAAFERSQKRETPRLLDDFSLGELKDIFGDEDYQYMKGEMGYSDDEIKRSWIDYSRDILRGKGLDNPTDKERSKQITRRVWYNQEKAQ